MGGVFLLGVSGGVGRSAGVVTAGVEWFKLYRSPGVDWFRGTVLGVLLLGRFFAWWDVVAYWAAIAIAVAADEAWVRRRWAGVRIRRLVTE